MSVTVDRAPPPNTNTNHSSNPNTNSSVISPPMTAAPSALSNSHPHPHGGGQGQGGARRDLYVNVNVSVAERYASTQQQPPQHAQPPPQHQPQHVQPSQTQHKAPTPTQQAPYAGQHHAAPPSHVSQAPPASHAHGQGQHGHGHGHSGMTRGVVPIPVSVPPPVQQQQQQQAEPHSHPQHQLQHQHHPQHPQPQEEYSGNGARAGGTEAGTDEEYRARTDAMAGILEHCSVLYSFASRYAQLQHSVPSAQPHATEVAEMTRRANEVVRLLEALRRMESGEDAPGTATNGHGVQRSGGADSGGPMDVDHARVPKRPWEEMNGEGEGEGDEEAEEPEQPQPYPTPSDTKLSPPLGGPASASDAPKQESTGTGEKTTAEQDMELIRTKRASTTGVSVGGVAGQSKSKYRKRSRATPPGKCHSCNIRETPEWRRGPDGARTLCNACGLHYAKLMRKREKEAGANGGAPVAIDMDTLRASARAEQGEKSSRKAAQQQHTTVSASSDGAQDPPAPPPPPTTQAHHEGSFQLTLATTTLSPSEVQAQMHAQPPPPPAPGASATWATQGYAPKQLELQHQHQSSFLRTPQIVGAGQASPR
ncbi:hypothetical protein B0H12DRAFT_337510 [Mycena haematopus]|nr:hypothetical protein B0H12DRAFT_337510 [Mycena haematopus]